MLAGRRSPWLSLVAQASAGGLAGILQLAFVDLARLARRPAARPRQSLAAGIAVEALRLADERRRRRRLERQKLAISPAISPPAVVERLAAATPRPNSTGRRRPW